MKDSYGIPMKALGCNFRLKMLLGGNHYNNSIQPVEFINANNLSYMQGNY